jgi:hypothetical protein
MVPTTVGVTGVRSPVSTTPGMATGDGSHAMDIWTSTPRQATSPRMGTAG